MKKHSILTISLALVTASLLASCSSSGGGSDYNPDSATNYGGNSVYNSANTSDPDTNKEQNNNLNQKSFEVYGSASDVDLYHQGYINDINKLYAKYGYNVNLAGETALTLFKDNLDDYKKQRDQHQEVTYNNNLYNDYFISNYPLNIDSRVNNTSINALVEGSFQSRLYVPNHYYTPRVLLVTNDFDDTFIKLKVNLINGHYVSDDKSIKLFQNAKNYDTINLDRYILTWDNIPNDFHGFLTGYLLAGNKVGYKPQSQPSGQKFVNISGVAPNSVVRFVGINTESKDLPSELKLLDEIYNTKIASYKPDVLYTAIGKQVADPYYENEPNLIQPDYSVLLANIAHNIKDNANETPLYVFPTGNYTKNQFAQVLTKGSSQEGNLDNYLYKVFSSPNLGLKLTYDSTLARLTGNDDVNKYFITVAGAVFDSEDSNSNLNYNYNAGISAAKTIDPAQNDPNTYKDKYVNEFSNGGYKYDHFNSARYTYETPSGESFQNTGKIYSPVGGYQCGAAAYTCISAPYNYEQPFVDNGKPYGKVKGTEYAAAYVAGAALLVKQKFPWMRAPELQTTLLTTATDVGEPGIDPVFGWGVLNINRALRGPAKFPVDDFNIDFNVNPRITGSISLGELARFITTDPNVNASYFNAYANGFRFYDFESVVGYGGLNITNSANELNSGLRIIAAQYSGKTNISSSVLILENPIYSDKYYYSFTNDLIASKTEQPFYSSNDKYIYVLNPDKFNHINSYKNRKQIEYDQSDKYEKKGLGGLLIFGRIGAEKTATNEQIYKYSNSSDKANDQKVANQHLEDKDLIFQSPITIESSGMLVSNIPQIGSVDNYGWYLPYSFITYGEAAGYYHAEPYSGSYVYDFKQHSSGVLVVGVGLKAKYPYDTNYNDSELSDVTVSKIDTNFTPVSYNYYSQYNDQPSQTPFARTNRIVSTAVFADKAFVRGQALIYFNLGSKITSKSDVKHKKEYIQYNSAYVPFIPSDGLYISLVNAHTLDGSFSSVGFLNNANDQKYVLSKVYLLNKFAGSYYSKTLAVEIFPRSSSDRAALSSGNSVIDQNLINNSTMNIDNLYTKANAQYDGKYFNQNYLALASAAQSSDNQNFRTFLYQNALTVYPDLQLATTQNSHSQVNNFIDRVANNYLHNVSHQVYFDYNYKQTNWTSPTSAIFGSDKIHNLSLGYYGQSYGLNYGLAGLVNYGTWNEDLTSLNADLDHLQLANLTNLASAKTITAGLVATIGKAQARSFYAINLSANFHNYDLTRNLLFLTETTKFNALDFELAGRYGYSLYHTDHSRFSVIGGLSLVDNYRLAVKETASINPTKLEQVTGNTDAQAVAAQFKYTSLDAKAHNALNMYASVALAYTYNFKVLNFNQALSVQGKAERVLNDLNFNINSNSNGSNLASTSVFNNNYIITAKATYQVNFTTNLKLDLYAAYTFCQNWQDKTAGTSLTYSF